VSGQLHAPTALPSSKEHPDTYWTGGWVGPRAGVDPVEKRKISLACRELNLCRPARMQSLYRLSYTGSWTVTTGDIYYIYEAEFFVSWLRTSYFFMLLESSLPHSQQLTDALFPKHLRGLFILDIVTCTFHPRLGLSNGLLPSGVLTKILYAFFLFIYK
jgi:hypothetical protein